MSQVYCDTPRCVWGALRAEMVVMALWNKFSLRCCCCCCWFFFFASVIIRHQEIIHDLVLAHGCFKKREDTGDVQSRSIWKQVFHTLIVIMAWWMFVFCLQASAWRHFFFVCVCVCLTLSFLSKLKFTMYRWTNILLLTTRSEQNQHSYCRLLTATGSEDQVVRSLLSAVVVVVVAPHFAESSLSSSSRLLFLSPPPPPR